MFVIAGSASTTAMSPVASARSSASTSLNSIATVVSPTWTGAPTLPSRVSVTPPPLDGERLVDRAVVAVAVDEHLRPPGELAGEPQRRAVGVGGAEREQPARQAEAPRQLLADPDRVLGRQHHRDAAAAPGGPSPRPSSAGECPAIAPVSPSAKSTYSWPSTSTIRAPSAVGGEHRVPAGPAHHPRHRDAADQRAAGALVELLRARRGRRRTSRARAPAGGRGGRGRSLACSCRRRAGLERRGEVGLRDRPDARRRRAGVAVALDPGADRVRVADRGERGEEVVGDRGGIAATSPAAAS